MSGLHEQLIDATIRHLEDLKARGGRFVSVAPETLALLKSVPAAAPASGLASLKAASASAPAVARPAPVASTRPASITPTFSPRPAAPSPATAAPVLVAPIPPGMEPVAPKQALDPKAKAAAIDDLRERAMVCVKCPNLASSRQNVVFGVGDINATLMFVGEAPGADEDAQGEPFVGAAGQLLTRIIQTMGLTRDTVYIANILKCRPDTPGQSSGNRKPTTEEMKTCIPYLHSQIDLIQPRVLVGLGGVAIEGLLGLSGITRMRGQWQTYRGIPLMPTFHPSYLLRNQALGEKRKVWEDMLQVMEKLGLPISEKQRGYFLKA